MILVAVKQLILKVICQESSQNYGYRRHDFQLKMHKTKEYLVEIIDNGTITNCYEFSFLLIISRPSSEFVAGLFSLTFRHKNTSIFYLVIT